MGFALPVKTVRRTKQLRCHFFPCPAICSIVAFSLLPHPQLACNLGEKMKLKGILINAILQALLPITDADALGLTDPKLCYILDGILLIYAIIITVLFMKVKLGNHPDESKPSQNANDIYNKLSSGHRDEYDLLGVKKTDTDLEMAGENQRRRKKPQDKVYTYCDSLLQFICYILLNPLPLALSYTAYSWHFCASGLNIVIIDVQHS
ncbi:T-cell surface glycoprotein CD3 zeta chain isoform 3-T3 [Liasis olivaceus]